MIDVIYESHPLFINKRSNAHTLATLTVLGTFFWVTNNPFRTVPLQALTSAIVNGKVFKVGGFHDKW